MRTPKFRVNTEVLTAQRYPTELLGQKNTQTNLSRLCKILQTIANLRSLLYAFTKRSMKLETRISNSDSLASKVFSSECTRERSN